MLKTKKEAGSRTKAKVKSRRKPVIGTKTSRFEETAIEDRLGSDLSPLKGTMSRLEARIPTPVYEAMERAAALRGLTLTAYVTATMGQDARRTIEETDIIRLSRADQIAFAEALINPPAPNAKLLAAAKRHAELFGK